MLLVGNKFPTRSISLKRLNYPGMTQLYSYPSASYLNIHGGIPVFSPRSGCLGKGSCIGPWTSMTRRKRSGLDS